MIEIIAHRGSSFEYPENTLAAVEAAWREEADAVEGDFQLTADGQIVCIHDDNTLRTTGVSRLVTASTLAELQPLDVGIWKHLRFAGERIQTLTTMLGATPSGRRYYVELKSGLEIIEPLKRAIETLSAAHSFAWTAISFYPEVVVALRQAFPELPVWLIVERRRQETGWWPAVGEMIAFARQHRLNGLDLDSESIDNAAMVDEIHAAGLKLAVWTVDDAQRAAQLAAWGVDALTTNRPGWLRRQLNAKSGG